MSDQYKAREYLSTEESLSRWNAWWKSGNGTETFSERENDADVRESQRRHDETLRTENPRTREAIARVTGRRY